MSTETSRPTSTQDHSAVFEHLRAALAQAQTERRDRADIVETTAGPEMAWMLHERSVMLHEVNRHRTRLMGSGASLVSERDVARVEQMAAGHVDYSKKWALYCADLVFTGSVDAVRP